MLSMFAYSSYKAKSSVDLYGKGANVFFFQNSPRRCGSLRRCDKYECRCDVLEGCPTPTKVHSLLALPIFNNHRSTFFGNAESKLAPFGNSFETSRLH